MRQTTQMIFPLEDMSNEDKAEAIITQYETDPLDETLKQKIRNEILFQFKTPTEIDETPDENTQTPIINRFQTLGDGSCGLHAIFGTLKNGYYQVENPVAFRKDIKAKLDAVWGKEEIPAQFKTILTDYFRRPQFSPESFKTAISSCYQTYKNQYDTETDLTKQEEIIEKFINDEIVKSAYLSHFKKLSTYLLQDELQGIAHLMKVNVTLHQPGWGNAKNQVTTAVLTEGFEGATHHIWYNGFNDYKYAELKN
jgi:hypothetical protein